MLKSEHFSSVKTNRVSEIIAKQIQKAIIGGDIRPGDRLPSEAKLVERFQASKFTVREALRSLEIFGFLEIRKGPSGGAVVKQVDLKPVKNTLHNFIQFQNLTVKNVFEVRMMIEIGAAEVAAVRRKKKDLETIRNLLEETEESLNVGKVISDLNVEFHLAIAKCCYNPILLLTTDYVLDLLQESVNATIKPYEKPGFSAKNLRDHWEIFRAIEASDSQGAKKMMTHHLKDVEKRLRPLETKLKVKVM
jgi:GntR family transcriptional regulator, transcriptional repressor for pyruvate dehydrogenase complex